MRRFAIACVVAGVLGACATPDAERFIDRYRLQAAIGPLYEIHGQDGVVGWLYGAVHYGTVERPSLSRAAARVLAQTRHIYLELTGGPGTPGFAPGARAALHHDPRGNPTRPARGPALLAERGGDLCPRRSASDDGRKNCAGGESGRETIHRRRPRPPRPRQDACRNARSAGPGATPDRLSGPPGGALLLEHHAPAAPVDADRVLGREAALEDRLRERILDLRLDGALERPRAVHRIEADLGQLRQRCIGDFQRVIHSRQPALENTQLDPRDGLDVLLAERVEDDHLVDAVHELRAEMRLHLGHDREPDHLVVAARHALDHLRAEVGGHHHHRVLEVHGAALAVGEPALVENLQEHVEYVRVRLLDLVEQDH